MNTRPETYIALFAEKDKKIANSLNSSVITRTNVQVRAQINREISNKVNIELIKNTK